MVGTEVVEEAPALSAEVVVEAMEVARQGAVLFLEVREVVEAPSEEATLVVGAAAMQAALEVASEEVAEVGAVAAMEEALEVASEVVAAEVATVAGHQEEVSASEDMEEAVEVAEEPTVLGVDFIKHYSCSRSKQYSV